jgi:hypothetical protein
MLAAIFTACLFGASLHSQQTKMDSMNLDRSRGILRDAYDNLKKHYYDPKFHGLDIEARYHDFDAKIQNAASLSQAFGLVAGFFDGLNDSHTFFEPPSRPYRVDYGYRMQIIGENAFITRVRPGIRCGVKGPSGRSGNRLQQLRCKPRRLLENELLFQQFIATKSVATLSPKSTGGRKEDHRRC